MEKAELISDITTILYEQLDNTGLPWHRKKDICNKSVEKIVGYILEEVEDLKELKDFINFLEAEKKHATSLNDLKEDLKKKEEIEDEV